MTKAKQTEQTERTQPDEGTIAPPAPETGTALSTQTANTAVALVEDYGDDAGAGMEDVGREEYRIPFLRILQALSPACKPVSAGGIAGARPGLIMNTATQELIDPEKEPIIFIPCARDHNYVEFPPRDGGGTGQGFQGAHEPEDPKILAMRATQGRFGKLKADNGNEISEVYYLYGIALVGDRSPIRCMVGFSGSQIKKYQSFIGQQMGIEFKVSAGTDATTGAATYKFIKPPMWAIRWLLSTVFESGKKGDYYNWQLVLANKDETDRPSALKSLIKKNDPLYEAGATFHSMIKAGEAKVDYAQAQNADDEAGTTNGGAAQQPGGKVGELGDEIPF